MNTKTLHLCNHAVVENIDIYIGLVQPDDAIIVFTRKLSNQQYNDLIHHEKLKGIELYFIVDENINNLDTINYNQWVDLVNQFSKTFTWK